MNSNWNCGEIPDGFCLLTGETICDFIGQPSLSIHLVYSCSVISRGHLTRYILATSHLIAMILRPTLTLVKLELPVMVSCFFHVFGNKGILDL